jgi:hypothetical protein
VGRTERVHSASLRDILQASIALSSIRSAGSV